MPSKRPRILVAESSGFCPRAAELLREAGDLTLADLDRNGLLAAVRDIDILWVRLRHRIDRQLLDAAPELKIIATPTTGLNHIDLNESRDRGIQVLSLSGETVFLNDIRGTAEHTLALMLALIRHLPAAATHARFGGWNRDRFKGRELHGKTVGVVGYGRLGRIVSRYLRAFDTVVLTADPDITPASVEPPVMLVPLARLLGESNLVTLHVNLSDKTHGFFGREQFSAMREGAWFINTSRGELVDETALLDALKSGHLAGAALDVVSGEGSERMENHPVVAYALEHENLILTPHIGGCTEESMAQTEVFLAEKVLMFSKSFAFVSDFDTTPHRNVK
jgi:D-3-phosphoglycerate dehydrogenase / 2-oxoglutarate reductase